MCLEVSVSPKRVKGRMREILKPSHRVNVTVTKADNFKSQDFKW